MFTQFYKKTATERLQLLSDAKLLTNEQIKALQQQAVSIDLADTIIENAIGVYEIPMGLATNFVIDNKTFHAPMATEEASVIAAANFGARLIGESGGFTVESQTRQMIGEIALYNVPNYYKAQQQIEKHAKDLVEKANRAYPSIVKRGGGATSVHTAVKTSLDQTQTFLIVYLTIDSKEAMGANMLNTMLEAIVPTIEKLTGGTSLMGILSNFATQSVVRVSCLIDPRLLSRKKDIVHGKKIRDRIVLAYQLASADIYRATTHNKGVMNGISAVVLATGNDTRAIEAGAHAYATRSTNYQPLTTWSIDTKTDFLKGTIELPVPIGTVGGSISVHPSAQIALSLSLTKNAKQLAALIASVGLAQNLAALRALVDEGIQQGHMALQQKALAKSIGASDEEIPALLSLLKQETVVNREIVQQLLNSLRN